MGDYTEAELRNKVTHWHMVAVFARRRYAGSGTKEDADSVTYAEAQYDRWLDQIIARKGGGRGVIPVCGSGGCGKPMSTFGTGTWLCATCDFRECIGCRERVHSFTAVQCPHCGYIVLAPRSADEELD